MIACFVVGARAGAHDQRIISEEQMRIQKQNYLAQIEQLTSELLNEQEIEHIEVEYIPVAVDYEIATDVDDADAVLLAKTLWCEMNHWDDISQCFAVCDCALWRTKAWGKTLEEVITAEGQFHGYNESNPVDERAFTIAKDVLMRHALRDWEIEQFGESMISTTIPSEYLYFSGNGTVNTFSTKYQGGNRITP